MTHSHVDPADLVAAARETLVAQLLPELPESRRHAALMAANALGVAQRALSVDPRRAVEEGSRLFLLLGGVHPDDGDPRLRLAALIRRGDFDTDGMKAGLRKSLVEHLRATVLERLAVDNPKLLPQELR